MYYYAYFMLTSCTSRKVAKFSSGGATLCFTLRSKGEGGQLRYLIIQEVAVHSGYPATNLKADPKHYNLRGFCDFCMEKSLLATSRKLRKDTCFCSVLSQKNNVNTVVFATRSKKKHRKHRGLARPRRKKHRNLWCFFLREFQTSRKHKLFDDIRPLRD